VQPFPFDHHISPGSSVLFSPHFSLFIPHWYHGNSPEALSQFASLLASNSFVSLVLTYFFKAQTTITTYA
jgi:hypothetical protein